MYRPRFNAVDDEHELRAMVAAVGAAELVTVAGDGYPQSTLLPILWEEDLVIAHMARANRHWREVGENAPVLLVCGGAQAYVSPSWYASKAEHGKVVPTWNYSTVHLKGRASVHEDSEWLRHAVTMLTERHEHLRSHPWAVTDAPAEFVESQLRAIVGIEIQLERVEGKAKLSQNRSEADRLGVIAGLRSEGLADAEAIATAMRAELDRDSRG
ncbi:MAG TPA: FMN-binding negative transcriptional regulator [Solirubrobacteraceae bacterium]|nr:FMN-binding negative transcriptional regulator [Solirubrobacteraceae bacterium]